MKKLRTCVTPEKLFCYGLHKPAYAVTNLRDNQRIERLGTLADGAELLNEGNFPDGPLRIDKADWIFEIPNPFAFRGTTFIDQEWAEAAAADLRRIRLPVPEPCSLSKSLEKAGMAVDMWGKLPSPVLLALATCSTDPQDLERLAELSCAIEKDGEGAPVGLVYKKKKDGRVRPELYNHALFEAVANNPFLPDSYKTVMVLRPGAQGGSEIVGEWPQDGATHVFEYLRRNSYIAGGHYAANMADDAVRYATRDLSVADMRGLRHLYYQRTYVRLADELNLAVPSGQRALTDVELEDLRSRIEMALAGREVSLSATLWGWNFGFDYAPSGYRLHASHQQIHQQYAMVPRTLAIYSGGTEAPSGEMTPFACGDMVAEVMRQYRQEYHSDFFADYIGCIANNRRLDGREDRDASLVLWQDEHAILFVPKAQTSQWELQLMALRNGKGEVVGNIIEADSPTRVSLDKGILLAQKALAGLGARMVTSIEYSKRIGREGEPGQHLLYALLPRLPESPGAFSEAQLRFINGHYPEDFAAACRQQLAAAEAHK